MVASAVAPLYVCVYVPDLAAQALLRLRSDLMHVPVAVLDGDPPLEQVRSTNRLAATMGVAHGMTRTELDSFHGLSILRRSNAEEKNAHTVLLQAAAIYTPRIEVQPVGASAFAMVLDMKGTERIFGTVQQCVSKIRGSLKALGFTVRIAACANLPVAICMAPYAAKKPVFVPMGEEAKYIGGLPLSALRLTDRQAETLSMWGLHTVGDLAVLPEEELVVRLGQEGKRLRCLARGEQAHLMVPEEPVFALEEYIEFDAPVEVLDSLLFVISPILDQLVTRATERSYALAALTVRMQLDSGSVHERTIKPALPIMQRDVLLKLLHLDLQAHPPGSGVVSLWVTADPGERSKVQLGLFAPQLPEAMKLDVTLARLAALVGEERVGRAALQDNHNVNSFVMEKFVVADAARQESKARRTSVALRRCRPPMEVNVQRKGEQPVAFLLQGKRYIVDEAYGPWRKSGDWWNADVWSWEEWDVRASKGEETLLCMLTYDLLRKYWRLEATYD